ncbi:MAG: PASTA domain-containing protein [Tannerella sp.]|jgi:beta-lactam-binding protein with PASTA domain|nr:PASTA domain-containing protein [Tannerella sp.]
MSVKHKTDNIFGKLLSMPVYVNILAAGALFCLMAYAVLKYIDVYTNHNKAVVVPDVRGLQIEDAKPFFEKNMLRYTVVDSIYSKDYAPGAIVEMMPGADSKVKKKRVINVTVNAKSEKRIAVPDVADISYREAFALLRSRGFMDIETKFVSGMYKDLTVGVQYGAQIIQSGTRVPVSAKLILVISDGSMSGYQEDSTTTVIDSTVIKGDESWF